MDIKHATRLDGIKTGVFAAINAEKIPQQPEIAERTASDGGKNMKTTESKERITTVSKKAIMYDTIYFFIGTDSKKDENIKTPPK